MASTYTTQERGTEPKHRDRHPVAKMLIPFLVGLAIGWAFGDMTGRGQVATAPPEQQITQPTAPAPGETRGVAPGAAPTTPGSPADLGTARP